MWMGMGEGGSRWAGLLRQRQEAYVFSICPISLSLNKRREMIIKFLKYKHINSEDAQKGAKVSEWSAKESKEQQKIDEKRNKSVISIHNAGWAKINPKLMLSKKRKL
eukprot:GEMP01069453.1.p1 GENE.GEMP01069453.1~~GEMP01069453.1.p1  ORF type:complete len:107 (-),score=2.02 GEMP01069453.1:342-662(-)